MLNPRRTTRPCSTMDALESLALCRRLGPYLIAPAPTWSHDARRATDVFVAKVL